MLWVLFRWSSYPPHQIGDHPLPCKPPLILPQRWALQVWAQPMSRTAITLIYSKRNSNIIIWCLKTTLTIRGSCNMWAIRALLCSRKIRLTMVMCPGSGILTQIATTASYSKSHQRQGLQWWWIWQLIREQSSLVRWCWGQLPHWGLQTSSWKK